MLAVATLHLGWIFFNLIVDVSAILLLVRELRTSNGYNALWLFYILVCALVVANIVVTIYSAH